MSLTDIEAVRLTTSDKSNITREVSKGDGTTRFYKLGHKNVTSLEVRINGSVVSTYTLNSTDGVVTFNSAPLVTEEVEFTYYWSIFSDDEVQWFLDDAGTVAIASAKLLLAIAADASKVAQRQAQAGGGGLGSVTLDTSVTARELRNTAQALVDMEKQVGEAIPAEGLTEPNWTEFNYRDMLEQRVIRDG